MKILKATTETVRQETFQGRDYTVVPVIAIVEGVLQAANSPQPELVKASEFDPASWNGRPVTFGHPVVGETLVSASLSPEIFEEVVVGTIFNSVVIDDSKLRVEAWIDNEKALEGTDEAVKAFEKIKEGEALEVSTGYFADSTQESGKFNGESFEAIQFDIKPDHLAILLGENVGACSIEDGCGTNRVNCHFFQAPILNEDVAHEIVTTNGTANLLSNLSFYGFDKHDPEEDAKRKAKKKNSKHDPEEDEEEDEEEENKKKKSNLAEILSHCQLKDNGEISDMDVRSAISSALEAKGESFWGILAVFQESFVFERSFGTLEKREFSIADNGDVSIANEGEVVRPVTEFVPVKINQAEEKMMNKEELIKSLIANEATQFSEEDRGFLEGLDEQKLSMLSPVEKDDIVDEEKEEEKEVEVSKNDEGEEDPKPLSTEEYIAAAPPEVKEVLNQGIKMRKEHRDSLTKIIISNSQFNEEEIKDFSMEQLEKLASTAAPQDHSIQASPVSNLGEKDDDKPPPAPQVWNLSKNRMNGKTEGAKQKAS